MLRLQRFKLRDRQLVLTGGFIVFLQQPVDIAQPECAAAVSLRNSSFVEFC